MTWQREFFSLAGFMLGCKMRANGGQVSGDSDPRCALVLSPSDRIGCQIGEMDYSTEMYLVLRESRDAPASTIGTMRGGVIATYRCTC
jgi:hypothetical protein